jgi:hypothetical protein
VSIYLLDGSTRTKSSHAYLGMRNVGSGWILPKSKRDGVVFLIWAVLEGLLGMWLMNNMKATSFGPKIRCYVFTVTRSIIRLLGVL